MTGPIGVFDSGYGGLTILREIVRELPEYTYLYLGDNARTPYGTRSFDVVYRYTCEAVMTLFNLGCPLVILACNTASSKALRTIQQTDLPKTDPTRRVLGVIRPMVEAMDRFTANGHLGILATSGTVDSGSYLMEIDKIHAGRHMTVTQEACPMWVPLAENGELDNPATSFFVQRHIEQLLARDPQIDALVLACTHYPLLRRVIERHLPAGVRVFEQGSVVAASLRDYLVRHPEMARRLTRAGGVKYYTTEQGGHFDQMARLFMGQEVDSEHIELDRYFRREIGETTL